MKTFKNIPNKIKSLKFSESEIEQIKKTQLLKAGTFSYISKDDITLDAKIFETMIANFNSKVRGVDCAVDYNHEAYGKAAGWISELFLENSGAELWASIDWTPEASESIFSEEYKYISAEFVFDYQTEDGQSVGPTILGAGLTNRPFLKNMKQVELSEQNIVGDNMEERVKKCEEDIVALMGRVKLCEVKMDELMPEDKPTKDEEQEIEIEKEVNFNEKAAIEAQKKDELNKKISKFNELLKAGKVCKAQEQAFIDGDIGRFAELQQDVKFESIGSTEEKKEEVNEDKLSAEQAEDKLIEIAKEEMKSGVSFSEGMKIAISKNKKLNEKYLTKFNL